jgi:hypothetical protein
MTRTLPKRDLRIGPEARNFLDAVNATGDPRRDNELVKEFLAAEGDPFRLAELKKDREQLRPESPWKPLQKEGLIIDLIRLCHWHYLETENPLFVFRALEFSQHLTAHNAHCMEWIQKYLLTAAASLARLLAHPPAAADTEAAFATALEFERAKYNNPFREAAAIIEADDLYDAVRRLILIGINTTKAMYLLAEKRGVSYEKIRKIYYGRQRLART